MGHNPTLALQMIGGHFAPFRPENYCKFICELPAGRAELLERAVNMSSAGEHSNIDRLCFAGIRRDHLARVS
jgi:hypothetical protein